MKEDAQVSVMSNPRPNFCLRAPAGAFGAGTEAGQEEGTGGLGRGKEMPIPSPPCGHGLLGKDSSGPPTPLFHAAPGTL